MSEKWTSRCTLHFVEEYGKKPCLWNPENEEYKNKQTRDAALQKIVTAMNLEESDISAPRKKMRIVGSTYRNERTKIMNSQKSDAGADFIGSQQLISFQLKRE
jgi:hypothetical protein